jgi:broad specificity phosphatase PhoE
MIRLLCAVLAAALLAPAASAQTVVIVRHGEKVDDSADPDLSAAGQARAAALAQALAGLHVGAVYTTALKRTRQTAQPTAAAAGVTAIAVSTEGGTAAHAERVAAEVRKAGPDTAVLVVGHSNTVPAIARALGDAAPPALTDCDYDTLTLIQLGARSPRVVHARYGAPSTAC